MDARTIPLKAIPILILLISLTGNLSGKSVEEHVNVSLADSLLLQLDQWEKQDSLLSWMTFLKSQSQLRRSADDVSGAISLLTECITNIWREPVNEEETKYLGWVYVNRAYLLDQKYGDYLAAKNDYLSALALFESYNYNDFYVASYLLRPLGNIYTRLGENEHAVVMLETFQSICRSENQIELLMNSYNDLGRAYMNDASYEKSIDLFNTGLKIDPLDQYNRGLIESSRAEAEFYLGEIDQGISSANSAVKNLLNAQQKMSPADFRYEACGRYITGAYTTLGYLNLNKNAFELSLEQFEQALIYTDEFYEGKHRRRGKILNGIGDSYGQSQQFELALNYHQRALIESIDGFDDKNPMMNPPDELLFADVVIGESLIAKAQKAKFFYDQTKKVKWLKLSKDTYLTYFRWVKKLRAEQLNIHSKLDLTKEIHAIGEETLTVIFELMEVNANPGLAEIAFQVMEQTKGIVLSESDFNSIINNSDPHLKEAIVAIDQLKMQKSLFQIEQKKELFKNDSLGQTRIKKRIEELDLEIQLQDFSFREKYKAYDRIRLNQNDSVDFNKLQVYLKKHHLDLLSYFMGSENLYAILSHEGQFNFKRLDLEGYRSISPNFLNELRLPEYSTPINYNKQANELFNILISDAFAHLDSNVLILPDGDLNLIPFEALVSNSESDQISYKSMNYLVLDHVIHYAPSVKFLLKEDTKNRAQKPYLGVAPIFEKPSNFPKLSFSEEEVTFAKELFAGDVLLKNEASKKAFMLNAHTYEIIHLSTHASEGSGTNNDGWIVFRSEDGDEKMLTPELLQLNLAARLVVLNGCETGLGEIYRGEGMLSMARGFIEAGAQSTVTNLWQVNHSANAKLMRFFYEDLNRCHSPSLALQNAKIAYLHDQHVDKIGAHPFYWAASVLIGTNHDVGLAKISQTSSAVFWFASAGFLLVFIAFVFYKRKIIAKKKPSELPTE